MQDLILPKANSAGDRSEGFTIAVLTSETRLGVKDRIVVQELRDIKALKI